MPTFSDAKTGAAITVKVTPRARKNEFVGTMEDGTLRVRVAAAPEAGAANQALVAFLAEALDIPVKNVDIVSGLSGERKLISLVGISPAQVEARVEALVAARAAKARAKAAALRKKNKD